MNSYDKVQGNKSAQVQTNANIDKNKSDMHDQRDLEIQLMMSLISSMVKQSGERERERAVTITCKSRIRETVKNSAGYNMT
jgi:hypothetical protein